MRRGRAPAAGRRLGLPTVLTASVVSVAVALTAMAPSRAHAQLTDPCGLECGLVLAASSFTFATGTMAAMGRWRDGYHTQGDALTVWSLGFVAAAGAGLGLQGDGELQRRAVYASGLGALAGALAGLTAESLVGESTAATRLAATLVGAAVGVVVGGAVGALSYEEGPTPTPTASFRGPTISIVLPFGS